MAGQSCGRLIGGRCGSCRTPICRSQAAAGAILFDGIAQPWLKDAAKRWARSRLLVGGAPSTMSSYVHHVAMFSGWLADRGPEVSSPAQITRAALEDWLLSIRSSGLAPGTKTSRVSAVRLFLEEQCQDGLARMPRSATIHAGEVPSAEQQLPRGIEAPVFDQLIDPANLALLPLRAAPHDHHAARVHRAADLEHRDTRAGRA